VPSPAAGTVKEVKVKVGDQVSEGDLILLLEAAAEQRPSPPTPLPPAGEGSQSSPVGSVGADLRVRPDGEGDTGSPVGSVGADLRVRPDGEGSGVRASSTQQTADLDCEMLVLGSGPGGYSAAFRA
ncbi:biotin/lipoyl-binding protein, partial [Arthrospira platensis SPKY1]|nr:biotin/lipoyl-binding protein [Arthrospira platensis SPKY1]